MIIDMHCDTISVLLEQKRAGKQASLRENGGHLDLVRMQKSGYLLQNFALFVNTGSGKNPWEEVCALHEMYEAEIQENGDVIAPVFQYSDIAKNASEGKMSAMLTVEEGAVCQGDMEKLHKLSDMGVRMMTLTWNYPNEIGFPNVSSKGRYTPDVTRGLTEWGRQLVREMEQLNMIIDVSHLSDAGFYDVLECTKKPFVASHSNARGLCPCVRNLTDDMIRKLAERGGVIGLNYYPDFLTDRESGDSNPGTIQAVVEHAKYIENVGGIEVLGLGSDFDGIAGHAELQGVQSMELLREAMRKEGFEQSQLDKIFFQNVLRLYKDTLS